MKLQVWCEVELLEVATCIRILSTGLKVVFELFQ